VLLERGDVARPGLGAPKKGSLVRAGHAIEQLDHIARVGIGFVESGRQKRPRERARLDMGAFASHASFSAYSSSSVMLRRCTALATVHGTARFASAWPRSLTETVKLCNIVAMKNITVSVPDDVYRQARVRAAERGTSVSALVRDYLRSLSDREAELARARADWNEIAADIKDFRAGDRLGRDELHERAVR
jgi:plasmid stability protein